MATVKNSVHAVGNLNSANVVDIPNVFAAVDIENYSLVELSFSGGKRVANYQNTGTEPYLACAVEVMYDNENYSEFYIGAGEATRVVKVTPALRFESSNYVQIVGTAPAEGQYASWDATAKNYKLSATVPATPSGGVYFTVVGVDGYGNLGLPTVRFQAVV